MALLLCLPVNAWSQASGDEELYTHACAACHGDDGAGRSIEDVGFDTPLPDFTDCEFASREPDPDWYAVIHQGGTVRAFDRMMPAFGTALFGPFDDVEEGLEGVMHSAPGYIPAQGAHVQESELCATCHTLFTTAYDDDGNPLEGLFPGQVPYLEWAQSRYREEESCQDCHMPAVDSAPISSVLGEDRDGVSQH